MAPEEVSIIAKTLISFSGDTFSVYAGEGIQLIHTAKKNDQLRIFEDPLEEATFFLQGDIFESSKGIEKIDSASPNFGLKNQLIKRYREAGIGACVGLNGIYNLLVWQHKSRCLEVACDRLGIFQIFYAPLSSNKFVVTTDILAFKSMSGFQSRIDKKGLFDLLYAGIAFENRTVLQGVERLLPLACYRLKDNNLQLLEELRLPFSRNRQRSLSEIMDEFEHLYLSAIKRQLHAGQKLIYLQSGGRDSRLYSHFLKKAGITPHCVTIGEDHHAEVFLAKQVDRFLKFPWKRINVKVGFNDSDAAAFFRLTNFSCRAFMPFQNSFLSEYPDEWDYLLSTFLADPVFGSIIEAVNFQEGQTDSDAFQNYLKFNRQGFLTLEELEGLIGPEAKELVYEYRKEAFRLFCDLAPETHQKIMAYHFRTNDRFKISGMMNFLGAHCPFRLPFLDNDLMDFLFSLPVELLYDRKLVNLYLVQNAKELASIPFDQNYKRCKALIRSFSKEFPYRSWRFYNEKIKFSILHYVSPHRATTQAYLQSFSLRDEGFLKLRKRTADFLPQADGILNIDFAREIFRRPIPQSKDHIISGNSIRALITAVSAIHTFLDNDAR